MRFRDPLGSKAVRTAEKPRFREVPVDHEPLIRWRSTGTNPVGICNFGCRRTDRRSVLRKKEIMMAESVTQELLRLNQRLLDSIANADWKTYEELCDPTLTCFEPEANG